MPRKRLRVLLDPVYITSANLTSSSTYHRYVRLCRELVKRGHFVYWMIPDVEYVPKEIENDPHVAIIRTAYIQDMFVVDGLFSDRFFNLFNRIAGKYHIDVLCTNRNSLVAYFKRILDPPRFHDTDGTFTDKGYGLPIVIMEDFAQTRHQHHTGRAYAISQAMGYMCSDLTIFHSDHNKSEAVREMLDFTSFTEARKFSERAMCIPTGIECKELDVLYNPDRWKVEKGFNVISLGRIFGVSYIEFLPWFDYLFKSGISDATFTISLSGKLSGPMRSKLQGIGFDLDNFGKQFILIENNARNNFISMLRKYHCFICPVSHYDHPMQLFEAMYLGVPGIIPISDYQQTFFPDYPFVIDPKDKVAVVSTMLWIREHAQEAHDMVLPWRDRIRERFNGDINVITTVDEIEKVARGYIDRFHTSKGVIDLCKQLKGEKYGFADVVAYLNRSGILGVSIGDMGIRTTFTYARSAIHHAMHLAGYVDPCDGPDDRFIREDIFNQEHSQTFANLKPPPRRRAPAGV